jgi:hypothetical protein
VLDPQGTGVAAKAELVSAGNQFQREFAFPHDGRYVFQGLASGVYRLKVTAEGFAPWTGDVRIRSEVPVHLAVRLAELSYAQVRSEGPMEGGHFPKSS